MRAGRLSVTVHEATLEGTVLKFEDEIYVSCTVSRLGKLCTESNAPGKGQQRVQWDEDLTFEVSPGPEGAAKSLQLAVWKEAPEEVGTEKDELLGVGTLALEGIEAEEITEVRVALVGGCPPGHNVGAVSVTLRFFPSRSPGKGRDALGREVIDPALVKTGNFAREMNDRSPRNSPRRSRSREQRRSPRGG